MKVFRTITIVIILLATTMVAINFLFMDQNTIPLITEHKTALYTYYTFNIQEYLKNIETSITNAAKLELKLPEREWINTAANITQQEFWDTLGNNMALILDYLIMILNVVIYPLRIGGYLLQQILSFIGVPTTEILQNTETTTNKLAWLVILTDILKGLAIPYV